MLYLRIIYGPACVYNSPTDTGFVTSVGRVRKCHHFLLNDKTSLWKPLTIHYVRHNTTKMPPLGSVIDSLRLLFYIFICFVRNLIYLHSIIHRFFFVKDACLNLTSNENCLFYLIHNRSVWSSISLTTERNTSNGCEGSIETNVSSSSSSHLQQEAKEA